MKSQKISHVVMLGDSLSDRGTMDHRRLFGMIPMDRIIGLNHTSPDGRFTNGFVWTDYLAARLSNKFLITDFKREQGLDSTDIADGVVDRDSRIVPDIEQSYTLDKDRVVDFKGKNLIRCYDEGGLTAHDYRGTLDKSMGVFFSRLIVSTLEEKRHQLLADDAKQALSMEHKAKTLVIEWSGANDLILANDSPSSKAVILAVNARIENVKELIKNGYCHFVLFNLPDISCTPRFQAKSKQEQENAKFCTNELNLRLARACHDLAKTYPHCSIDVFDVYHTFEALYQNPEPLFSKDKLKVPYNTSKDFKITPEDTSPAAGYMFWDEVHPTANMHAQLAQHFCQTITSEYEFQKPVLEVVQSEPNLNINEEALMTSFKKKYVEKLCEDRQGFFGFYRRSNICYQELTNLDQILRHALFEGGYRTLSVIKELQWLDEHHQLKLNIPALKEAFGRVQASPNKTDLNEKTLLIA